AAGAVFAALAVGLALTLWQAQQARQQAARAEEIKRFILSVFTSANPLQGGGADLRAVDLLVRARERVEQELTGRDTEQIELLCPVGVSLWNLSAIPEARRAYESAFKIGPPDGNRTARVGENCQLDYAIVLMAADEHAVAEQVLAQLEPTLRAAGPSLELG